MLEACKFYRLENEFPYEHLEDFQGICSFINKGGAPEEVVYLKMFPFTLAGRAKTWLKNHPPGSFTTWEALRGAFLEKFYPLSKIDKVRDELYHFRVKTGETLPMAHERFLDLTRKNANCGFTGPMLLQMFFRGIDHEMRNMINAATPGNDVYGIPVDEAFKVIESVAKKKSASLKMKPEWVEVGSNESKANPRHIAPGMYKVAATSHELDEMKETVEAHKAKCSDLESIIKK